MSEQPTSKEQFLADLDKAIAACKKTLTGRLGMSLEQFEAIRAFVATSHEPSCLACEDRPGPANDPCLACGRSSHEPEAEPVAWRRLIDSAYTLRPEWHYTDHQPTISLVLRPIGCKCSHCSPPETRTDEPQPCPHGISDMNICPVCDAP
jgi:hypothetical protein